MQMGHLVSAGATALFARVDEALPLVARITSLKPVVHAAIDQQHLPLPATALPMAIQTPRSVTPSLAYSLRQKQALQS